MVKVEEGGDENECPTILHRSIDLSDMQLVRCSQAHRDGRLSANGRWIGKQDHQRSGMLRSVPKKLRSKETNHVSVTSSNHPSATNFRPSLIRWRGLRPKVVKEGMGREIN